MDQPVRRVRGENPVEWRPHANRFQNAALGRKSNDFGGVSEVLLPKHLSRRQGCVAAQIDLGFRREPAKVEALGISDQKGSLRQVHLPANCLQPAILFPRGQKADSSRVARKGTVGKGIDVKKRHRHNVPPNETARSSTSSLWAVFPSTCPVINHERPRSASPLTAPRCSSESKEKVVLFSSALRRILASHERTRRVVPSLPRHRLLLPSSSWMRHLLNGERNVLFTSHSR